MANYDKPNTKLAAAAYQYNVTLMRDSGRAGLHPSHDAPGTYTPQPGETVNDFLTKIANWYSQTYNVPRKDVRIVRYTLKEK